MKRLLVCIMLSGCATVPTEPLPIVWVPLQDAKLQSMCNTIRFVPARVGIALHASWGRQRTVDRYVKGCAIIKDGVCYTYTRTVAEDGEAKVADVRKHEERHCREGRFHD